MYFENTPETEVKTKLWGRWWWLTEVESRWITPCSTTNFGIWKYPNRNDNGKVRDNWSNITVFKRGRKGAKSYC